jgi:endonuclease YncB( thermonuclease family)
MKNLRLWLFTALVLAVSAPIASSQHRTFGEVVEVLDGKTVVVAVPTGRVKVELQYIDVPEDGQALHAAMKAHLQTLVVGKAVELQTKGFSRDKLTGKLVVKGVDVSQQMLRDGAAWHLQFEKSGQSQAEFAAYAESETLAKLEKRGVWSVPGLEPAWEFREKKRALAMPPKTMVREAAATKPATTEKKYWSDNNPRLKSPALVAHGFNAATQTGFLATPVLGVTNGPDQPKTQKTAVQVLYHYTERGEKGRTGYFLVKVVSMSDEWRFPGSSPMVLEVDGKKYPVGKPKKDSGEAEYKLVELLVYEMDPSLVERIANGSEVFLKIGNYMITPKPAMQMILHNMLEAAKVETKAETRTSKSAKPREQKKVVKN